MSARDNEKLAEDWVASCNTDGLKVRPFLPHLELKANLTDLPNYALRRAFSVELRRRARPTSFVLDFELMTCRLC